MSSHVRQIQTLLKESGLYAGVVDGIAGKLTVEAVKKAVAGGIVGSEEVAIVEQQHQTHPENKAPSVTDSAPVTNSGFVLGERSLRNLAGVNANLVKVVKRAIGICKVDFTVIEGVRTVARQRELVRKGASKTMNSRHISGNAVDIVPVINGVISWKFDDYYPLAQAMAQASTELGVRIRWGGAWQVITNAKGHPSEWVKAYRAKGGRFLDAPHFEIPAN